MIYVASKTKHAAKWKALRESGIPISSTWIDEAGEGESKDLADLALRCIGEASICQAFLIYAEEGEILKGPYIELGAAMANKVPVYAVGCALKDSSAFRHYPDWYQCGDIGEAFEMIVDSFLPDNADSPDYGIPKGF